MAFTEDLSVFFDETDFAISATIAMQSGATRIIQIIFDASQQVVGLYDTNVEANTPQFMCKTSDLVGVRTQKDSVLIESETYLIGRIENDGTGVSTVYLK